MSNEEIPEAGPDEHARVWSMGNFNDSIIVADHNVLALDMAVNIGGDDGVMPVIALHVEGLHPGQVASVYERTLLLMPVETAELVHASIGEHIAKVKRARRASIAAMEAPKEETL